MAIEVETKDCTAVADAELEEMADVAAEGPNPFSVGFLSKQAELWVLVTTAREGTRLKGFSFCTLERIGGTPSIIVGAASIARNSRRDTVLRALVQDQLRRALLAFPDEDVLVGARLDRPDGLDLFKSLDGIIPRPDHRANGEERAWGRRLAKRYGIGNGSYNERTFISTGEGEQAMLVDHESTKPETVPDDVVSLFGSVEAANGDTLIVHGWAMAEDLLKLG